MCGIAGLLRFQESVSTADISAMITAQAHRGPDGHGVELVRPNLALGHARLSIIDPSLGKQPMTNEDGSLWITFNGEIYNYQELRQLLLQRGHHFKTNSDTEVIIHSFEEWGPRCVTHFRGMFAFAIANKNTGEIFLARDHLGIKPLVYYVSTDCFGFSSEIGALRAIAGFDDCLRLESLDFYLALQYIPAPMSIYQNVFKLPPANYLMIDAQGKTQGPQAYWQLDCKKDITKSEDQWLAELDASIRQSVQAHLVSDVPFGAFLSGGVDSAAIVSYMAELLGRNIKTFTIGFDEKDFSEIKRARLISQQWQTDHHEAIVRPDAIDILPKLVSHYGEPFGDSSAIPTYYLAELARKYVPMVLSGDGGDELFAGYSTYLQLAMHEQPQLRDMRYILKKQLKTYAAGLFPYKNNPSIYNKRTQDIATTWASLVEYFPETLRQKLFLDKALVQPDRIPQFFQNRYQPPSAETIATVQAFDVQSYLPYDILTKVDIASMAHGLEVRTPLVDYKVLELAVTIPQKYLIQKNSYGLQGKMILKRLMEKHYTPAHLYGRKKGFAVPLKHWFSAQGALYPYIQDTLQSPNSPLRTYFDCQEIGQLIKHNASEKLWLLVFLNEWLLKAKLR